MQASWNDTYQHISVVEPVEVAHRDEHRSGVWKMLASLHVYLQFTPGEYQAEASHQQPDRLAKSCMAPAHPGRMCFFSRYKDQGLGEKDKQRGEKRGK